jgi:DNA-binding response OmpR family regulator
MKILIADDDVECRRLLGDTLTHFGHEVIATENGRGALDALRRQTVKVVILDWLMPELDGLAVCRRLRGKAGGAYIYIVLITALGGKNYYLEGMAAGADDFLTKPFDLDELQARLRVAERIVGLQEEVRQLEGLLHICMYCKKIRDGGDWTPLEHYVSARTDASFSHGVCPACFETRMRPDLGLR